MDRPWSAAVRRGSAKGLAVERLADIEAEEALIGGCLAFPTRLEPFADMLVPEDFYVPAHQRLWEALVGLHFAGAVIDPVVVRDRAEGVEPGRIVSLITNAPGAPTREHAEIVLRRRLGRDLLRLCADARQTLEDGADPVAVADQLSTDLGRLEVPGVTTRHRARSLDEVVETANDRAPWLVPGLFRVGWRVMVVAGEGAGKSTLTRQVAALAAQGLHPFRFTPCEPVPTLVVDPENDAATIAETGARLVRTLRQQLGDAYRPERCQVVEWRGGFDLRQRRDRLAVEAEIAHTRPRLVVLGSLYQTFRRREGESHEDATEPLLKVLDSWRARYGVALLIEHHAPQGRPGERREIRPFGSSLFLRWPEIGIGLREDDDGSLTLGRWRGDRLRSAWPSRLRRGPTWPWIGTWDDPRVLDDLPDRAPAPF